MMASMFFDGFRLFDLGNDRRGAAKSRLMADQRLQFQHFIGRSHKTQRDPVHLMLQRKADIVQVFLGQGRDIGRSIRQIHAFLVVKNAADHHPCLNFGLTGFEHAKLDQAVVQQDSLARLDHVGQGLILHRH